MRPSCYDAGLMNSPVLDALRIELDPIGQSAIALALMLIMFGIALGLRAADFSDLLQRRGAFAGGLLTQVAGLPLLTLLLVMLISPPPSMALGMFVVACCPGGAVSNLYTSLARGDVAYSVSLTTASSVLAAFLTPISIVFWSQCYAPTANLLHSIAFNSGSFLLQTIVLLALPLTAGMLLAARAPLLAARVRLSIKLLGAALLSVAVIYGSVRFFTLLRPALPFLGVLTIVHNATAFAGGAAAAWLMRAPLATRRALIFEIGIQNSGLAIVILLGQFSGLGGAAAIAAVWGVWHLVAGGLLVLLFRQLDRRRGTV